MQAEGSSVAALARKQQNPPAVMQDEEIARCLSSRTLHLILMPTEACNFRCTYCYEAFEHGRMRPDVVQGVKHLLTRSAGRLDTLSLCWFGGEPLLAQDLVAGIMLHARDLAKRHPGLAVHSDISTNAYLLTEAVFRRLLSVGVRSYQISFDGDAPEHDRKRVRAGGGDSFRRIWNNLLAMRRVEGSFRVLVRLHVDRNNVPSARRFIRRLARSFAGDNRFILFVRPLSRLGGPSDDEIAVLDPVDRDSVIESLRAAAIDLGVPVYRSEVATPICYASRANSFVVRADGRVNKCTQSLEHPHNQVGRLHPDGSLEVDGEQLQPWMRGIFTRDASVLRCPMKGLADVAHPTPAVRFPVEMRR